MTALVKYAYVVEPPSPDAPPQPAQGRHQWLPFSPVQTHPLPQGRLTVPLHTPLLPAAAASPETQVRRGLARGPAARPGAAGRSMRGSCGRPSAADERPLPLDPRRPLTAACRSPAPDSLPLQAVARKLYRFLRRAFAQWQPTSSTSMTPTLKLWLALIAPWRAVTYEDTLALRNAPGGPPGASGGPRLSGGGAAASLARGEQMVAASAAAALNRLGSGLAHLGGGAAASGAGGADPRPQGVKVCVRASVPARGGCATGQALG